MIISALTQGLENPSARFRIRQLIRPLQGYDRKIIEFACSPGAYPPFGSLDRLIWGGKVTVDSLRRAIQSRKYQGTILQRELISTLPSFEFLLKKPTILDVDDAIWLHRGGISAINAARHSCHIIAGNSFIAEYFSKYQRNISIIPTAVDIDRFTPAHIPRFESRGIIGWSGTSGGYKFFTPTVLESIGSLLKSRPLWRLRIVSNCAPSFPEIPTNQLEFIPWSPDSEAKLTAEMDIGIMPLAPDPWCLGKCSYKMLLYMACGIPVVVSDFGMNAEVLREGKVGFGAKRPNDWAELLDFLMGNSGERVRIGAAGRALVLEKYSIQRAAKLWNDALNSINRI